MQRQWPHLRGRQFVVFQGQNVVAVSKAAQRAGITTEHTLTQAKRLAPRISAFSLAENMDLYNQFAKGIWDTLARITPLVEPLQSPRLLPQVYADITGCGNSIELIAKLSRQIQHQLQLSAYISLAPNKPAAFLLAHYGIDRRLPSPLIVQRDLKEYFREITLEYVHELPEDKRRQLYRLGITTLGEAAKISPDELALQLADPQSARYLHNLANGQGDFYVKAAYPPPLAEYRSNLEATVAHRKQYIEHLLGKALNQIALKLQREGLFCRHLVLELMASSTSARLTAKHSFAYPTQDPEELNRCGLALYFRLCRQLRKPPGSFHFKAVCSSDSYNYPRQPDLLLIPASESHSQERKKTRALSYVRERWGRESIKTATSIPLERREHILSLLEQHNLC